MAIHFLVLNNSNMSRNKLLVSSNFKASTPLTELQSYTNGPIRAMKTKPSFWIDNCMLCIAESNNEKRTAMENF